MKYSACQLQICVYMGIRVSREPDTHQYQNPLRCSNCPLSKIISTSAEVQQKKSQSNSET